MKTSTLSLLTAALALGFCAAADTVSLKVGDPAPKLQTGKFVQGEPVTEFAPGKAYIVEFWATWCGPCKVSIPHLNETHNKYKGQGLVVIGQDCWEKDDALVGPFLEKMGDKMSYRVALDDKEGSKQGKMSDTWMTAAGRNGIPSAFLIDKTGHVAWIGHPMDLKDKTIEDVLAGNYDPVARAAAEEIANDRIKTLLSDAQAAAKAKDWDKAGKLLDELAELSAGNDNQTTTMLLTRFNVQIGKKDYPSAYKTARQVGDMKKDVALYQNVLALLLTTDESIEKPDLDLALQFSQRAVELTTEPVLKSLYLDTQARIRFMMGNKEEAISLSQKAVDLIADNPKAKSTLDVLQKGLASLKKGELPEPTWKRKPAAIMPAAKQE